ncbi:MAG: glycoside hydrolase family 43 protein [Oligoflexus sp.]|nr:glycoside hydrolase family 43 protein [Pseudopedobacter sp.]
MKKNSLSVLLFTFYIGLSCQCSYAQKYFNNPILKGFYPDPSICRAVNDYYLVCSSNEYYPGIPLFHSKDLVNWQQIGHVLDRPDQVRLDSVNASGGIFAPTIRYHNGVFYVLCTRAGGDPKKRNFIVTATDPAGQWSDPYWLEDAPGIDPSLFFDDDGKAWYTGNRTPEGGERYFKQREIWLQEFDIKNMKLKGLVTTLLDEGAVRQARNIEAPHIYKVNGFYYLVIAEGGTDFNHAATIFRSKNISGPYETGARNPIITSRHLGMDYPIQCIGHADFVETQNGQWYTVLLGTRPYGGKNLANLARETFLAPMTWEEGWPVVAPREGRVLQQFPLPNLPEFEVEEPKIRDDFDAERLGFQWNVIRTPNKNLYSLNDKKGTLRLFLKPQTISEKANPAFIGRRQQHKDFNAATLMTFSPKNKETAGLLVYQNPEHHFKMEYLLKKGKKTLRLTKVKAGKSEILIEKPVNAKQIYLKVCAKDQDYNFYYGTEKDQWLLLRDKINGSMLNRSTAGGFTGVYLAMYGSSNGNKTANHADFAWFDYQEMTFEPSK